MNLRHLIEHPEQMDRETLYDLRSFIALHPFYQTARILLLLNLYILHDATFDEELRTAAIYVTDRRILFNMIEAAHYKIHAEKPINAQKVQTPTNDVQEDRTEKLIDSFLNTLPQDEDNDIKEAHKKPTQKDATVDYVAYLMNIEDEQDAEFQQKQLSDRTSALIDHFMEDGGFNLKTEEDEGDVSEENHLTGSINQNLIEEKVTTPPAKMPTSSREEISKGEESYFTETLSRIYIKQGRYEKALEIITQLNLNIPKNINKMGIIYTLFVALIVLAAILMVFVVLIQESKGGGLASNFSSSNSIMGVRKTTNVVEKATWALAIAMVILSIACAYVAPQTTEDRSVLQNAATETQTTNPANTQGFGTGQQMPKAPQAPAQ